MLTPTSAHWIGRCFYCGAVSIRECSTPPWLVCAALTGAPGRRCPGLLEYLPGQDQLLAAFVIGGIEAVPPMVVDLYPRIERAAVKHFGYTKAQMDDARVAAGV